MPRRYPTYIRPLNLPLVRSNLFPTISTVLMVGVNSSVPSPAVSRTTLERLVKDATPAAEEPQDVATDAVVLHRSQRNFNGFRD